MRKFTPSWLRILVIFFSVFIITELAVDTVSQPAFIEQPILMLFLLLVLVILIALEVILGSLRHILYQSLDAEGKERFDAASEKPSKFITWVENLYEKSLDTKSIEEEHEIILDHEYDGIRELDNNLPPWWKYGFYITIVGAVIYFAYYQFLGGDDQQMELDKEYAQARIDIEEYKRTAKDLVDFNTVEVLTDAGDLSRGKLIFEENCVACHKSDGGGGIGPNLTDEHWILGGGVKNIFKTVSEGGRPGKGMVAWKTMLKPLEMAQVSSYILQFQGTTPAEPKEPEGEIWAEATE